LPQRAKQSRHFCLKSAVGTFLLAFRAAESPLLRPHGLKRWWGAQLIRPKATPWCIRFALDHAQRDVTGLSYIDPFDELAGPVDQVALPEVFTTRLRRSILSGRVAPISTINSRVRALWLVGCE
jgi:hypothetical protein